MKKIFFGFLFLLSFLTALSAQKYNNEPTGVVLGDTGPVVNPDMMTYFQTEVASLIRYQNTLEKNAALTPWFLSFRLVFSFEDWSNIRSNDITNALIGGQFKINNALSVPIFAAMTYRNIDGVADSGSLVIDGLQARYGAIQDTSWDFFPGSGLSFTSSFFQGSVFMGDHIRIFDGRHGGSVRNADNGDTKWVYLDNESVTHSFKIVVVPVVYTSEWSGVGRILNKAMGYISMGDPIEFGEVKKDATADMIVKALNFGLDLSFSKFGFDSVGLRPAFFYHRENYDAIAKTNDYGFTLELLGGWRDSINYLLASTVGYRQFYEVSPYFQLSYSDTYFYKFSLALYLRPDGALILGGLKINVFCAYDTHRNFTHGFTIGIGDAVTALFNYKGFQDARDFGIRYRYGGIRGFDKEW
jgi:hypothetical protein